MKTNKLLNKILAFYLVFGLAALLAAMLLFYIFQKKHFASETAEYITFFLTMMAGLVVATRLIYKRFWNPFFRTLEQIERFNIKSDEMPILPQTNVREFAQLNSALAKLAENSKNTYRIQKEFTENASHEM
ncbi:MAG: hypothetical protein LBN23_03015, partial [Paludibacter sp.]|nr:hypothetical protein [Paludibacter sp.]